MSQIGDHTQIGPEVQTLRLIICATQHCERASGLEFGRPVRIGRNVWIGAGG
jgi:maltose O-acetyltransferase